MRKLDAKGLKTVTLVLLAYEMVALWLSHPDLGLDYLHSIGVGAPYGALWELVNPLWWTTLPYMVYITILTILFAGAEYWLVTKGKLPVWIMIANQLQNVLWFSQTGFQNITTTFVQALSFWNPLFMGVWLVMKLPVGWSWPVQNNTHWQCAFGPLTVVWNYMGGSFLLCGPNLTWGSVGLITWHVMEFAWVFAPAIYWIWRWRLIPKFLNALRQIFLYREYSL